MEAARHDWHYRRTIRMNESTLDGAHYRRYDSQIRALIAGIVSRTRSYRQRMCHTEKVVHTRAAGRRGQQCLWRRKLQRNPARPTDRPTDPTAGVRFIRIRQTGILMATSDQRR